VLTEETIGRLENWKFAQAEASMDHQGESPTDAEASVVRALSGQFGNCGWFEGTMATVVAAALDSILPDPPGTNPSLVPGELSGYTAVWVSAEPRTLSFEEPATGSVISSTPHVIVWRLKGAPVTGPFRVVDIINDERFGLPSSLGQLIDCLVDLGPAEPDAYRPVLVEAQVATELMTYLQGRCPDKGTCHHACSSRVCWRVLNTSPLSGVFPDDAWPPGCLGAAAQGALTRERQKEAR
jgi:hypothetical protein